MLAGSIIVNVARCGSGKTEKISRKVRNIAYLWNFLKIVFMFLTTWSFMFACLANLGCVKMRYARPIKKNMLPITQNLKKTR